MRRFIGLSTCLSILLAGCAPHIEPQVKAISDSALGLAGPAAPQAPSQWWTAFGDPQLDRIMTDALAGSPTLDAAMARVRRADAIVSSSEGERQPQFTLKGEEQYTRLPENYIIPPPYGGSRQWVGNVSGNFSWTLDFWGRQASAIRQARASRDAAALDAAAARLALTGTVVQTYVELYRVERRIEIARASLRDRTESLKLTQVRVRTQLASRLDERSVDTLVAQANQALVRAEGQRDLTVHALAALAGRGADYHATIGATKLALAGALPLPDVLPADLLARRPDILAAKARIEAAAQGREVARKAFYPNINLLGLVGFQALGLGNMVDWGSRTASGGAAFDLPILDGGKRKADYRGATADLDVAVADYNDDVLGAVRDAADAITRVDSARKDLAQQRAVLGGLSETDRLNQVRVRSGLDSRLDTIESGIRLLEAQLGVADLEADNAIRRVQLLVAVGGDFDPAASLALNGAPASPASGPAR